MNKSNPSDMDMLEGRREIGMREMAVKDHFKVVGTRSGADKYDNYWNWKTGEDKENHIGRRKIFPESTQTLLRIY